eukprot:Seg50.12 transcript_id=Seg50.12/GoldUCD/mRNA.D3Y31 product="Programmed cell death protein 6" protein_id=Seg50.12/GoldUCD/D3Y31
MEIVIFDGMESNVTDTEGTQEQYNRNEQRVIFYQKIDRNGDGHINGNELQVALKNGSWTEFNPETVRLMIGMFDRDKNGTIDFNEFNALWQYVTDWSATFRNYDLDNSGAIDRRELIIALKSFGYNVSERIIDILMRRFDRTGTGEVRFDDFIQLCSVLSMLTDGFKTYDRNLSGWVDLGYEQFLTLVFSLRH